jgi:putative SOS response-associated peptidase YedK
VGTCAGWAKDEKIGAKLINARADGVATKPSFRSAFKKRRCLIPASGFFKWKTTGKAKQPYHFRRRDGKSFLFAGLWETWGDGKAPLLTCCLITTDANGTVGPVHDRMPAILAADALEPWLELATTAFRSLWRPRKILASVRTSPKRLRDGQHFG